MVAVRAQPDWLTSCLCVFVCFFVCVCICHRHCSWLWWKPIGLMLIDEVPARLVIANYHRGSQLPSRSGSFLHSEEKTKLDGKFCNWCQHPPPGLHDIEDIIVLLYWWVIGWTVDTMYLSGLPIIFWGRFFHNLRLTTLILWNFEQRSSSWTNHCRLRNNIVSKKLWLAVSLLLAYG